MPDEEMSPDMEDMDSGCVDDCSAGAFTCEGDGAYRTCGQYDQDACLEFSPPVMCAQGTVCDGGRCVSMCRNECALGGTLCADEQTVQVCGNFDQDACLEAGGDVSCASGERCEQGACVDASAACSDECAMDGATVCFGDAVRTCSDVDSDSCLDLGPPIACGLGEACEADQCVPSCTDECPAQGATECLGDAERICDDIDQDACLEWTPPVV